MENFNKIWRAFFAIMLIAIAIQQLVCADFRPVILPPDYPGWLADRIAWTWIASLLLIAANGAILFDFKGRKISLIMADAFLLMLLAFHIPYCISTGGLHSIGVWGNAFKMLVLSGGAYIVAGTFEQEHYESKPVRFSAYLLPAGKYFFCITMIVFGAEHFIYKDFVATLVPAWIPGHYFWTYFAGIALMASGVVIAANSLLLLIIPHFPTFPRRYAAFLLGFAIFSWFIVLHIPRAIADPHSGNGNEWTSVFEAFGFSGIAFILSGKSRIKYAIKHGYERLITV
ncbi:MAG: hypothetical protein JSU01_09840 [Bacteroidetes bacterium]|nr:hypothetical protein [Bacteroidota bacterium]